MDNGATLRKQKYAQTCTADHTESGVQWQAEMETEVLAEAGSSELAAAPDLLRDATAKVAPCFCCCTLSSWPADWPAD